MLGGLYLSYGEHRLRGRDLRARARRVRRSGVARSLLVLPREDLARARLSTRGRGGARAHHRCAAEGSRAAAADAHGRGADVPGPLRRRARGARGVEEARRRVGRLREIQHRRRARAVGEDRGRCARARRGRSSSSPKTPQLAALRDKANVALGYAWLQASRPVEAKPSLAARAARRPILEQGVARRRLVGRGEHELSRRARAVARAERPQLARFGRAGVAARGSLRVSRSSARRSRRPTTTSRPSTAFAAEITRLTTSIDAIEHGDLITELLGEHPDCGRRRLRLVLALGQGAGHDREPIPL